MRLRTAGFLSDRDRLRRNRREPHRDAERDTAESRRKKASA